MCCIQDVYIYNFFCQLQKELFGGGEAGQPDGMTSRKMSNGSTGSPKLKWLKAFKSLKTSSPTTPPLSDKWATYFLSTNTNFHHVHAAKKRRQSFPRDGDGFLHRAIPGTIYLLSICTLWYKSRKWKRIIFAFRVNSTLIVSCFSLLNFVSRRSVENSAAGIHSWDAQIGNFISQHWK